MTSAIFSSWTFDPWFICVVVTVALLYARGGRGLVGRVSGFPRWRPTCFFSGLAVLTLAVASPIESLGHLLLWVHMVQHWLLIMVVAPLLVLGAPGVPVLRGLPRVIRTTVVGPFLASPAVRRCVGRVLSPAVGWLSLAVVTWTWHTPAFYGAALESPLIHKCEHASFLLGAVLFWWQIVQPWPWKGRWSDGALVVYLLTADVQNTIFSSLIAFSDRVWYANYQSTTVAFGWDPVHDQQFAGAFMWTAGQLVMLPVAVFLILRALGVVGRRAPSTRAAMTRPRARRTVAAPFDLLRVRWIGAGIRTRPVRTTIRWVLVGAALLIVIDGFLGPADGPSNLAGTLPWTHWRGLIVVVLLCGGNFLCMSCPLIAPRNWLRSWWRPRYRWPERLRSKWLAGGLIAAWLICYEAFDLWASPTATAWIIVGYFGAILIVDGLFRGGSFCKWVCPIGQLHMAQSLVAPLTVSVISPSTCETCTGHECIRGSRASDRTSRSVPLRIDVPGCELELFQPAKRGNFDCTFCLDCVDGCPHGNVGIRAATLSSSLSSPAWGSSIGRIASRRDVAALLTLLTWGAFANAAGMTEGWIDTVARGARVLGGINIVIAEALATGAAILVVPACALMIAACVSACASGKSWRETFCLGAHALVPLGAAMWCIHWCFHLVTGASTAIPVMQRAFNDVGIGWFGQPQWAASCCGEIPPWLQPAELVLLQLGLLISGWMVWRSLGRTAHRALAAAIPWWTVAVLLWMCGCWIIIQPMQMRGTASL